MFLCWVRMLLPEQPRMPQQAHQVHKTRLAGQAAGAESTVDAPASSLGFDALAGSTGSQDSTGSHASSGLTGSRASAEVTTLTSRCPLAVDAVKEGLLSRILPVRRSRSPGCPLLRTPVTISTSAPSVSPGFHHLLDYRSYICHALWFLPQALLTLFGFHVCTLFVFLVLYFILFLY